MLDRTALVAAASVRVNPLLVKGAISGYVTGLLANEAESERKLAPGHFDFAFVDPVVGGTALEADVRASDGVVLRFRTVGHFVPGLATVEAHLLAVSEFNSFHSPAFASHLVPIFLRERPLAESWRRRIENSEIVC